MTCGVYEIVAPSGKRYVGSSVDMETRRSAHFSLLRRRRHSSPALQAAWKKYGDRLQFQPLLICASNLRLFYEQRAIDVLRPKYNSLSTAMCSAKPGHVVSHETRTKLSAINRGRRMGAAISLPWKGKKLSAEHRAKIAAGNRGNRIRAGAVISVAMRARISAKLKGRPRSLESRAKQSATWAEKRAAHVA